MSTRGAIGFRIDGKDFVAYNHYDSYPAELGANLVDELKTADLTALPERVRKIILVDSDKPPTQEQIAASAKWTNLNVSEKTVKDWYCLLRETQGTLEPYINGELSLMVDSEDFLLDGLFCEWAYIVNLDDNTFEVYQGFDEDVGGVGRYALKHQEDEDEYYGVVLIDTIPLSELVEADIDALIAKWENWCPNCKSKPSEGD